MCFILYWWHLWLSRNRNRGPTYLKSIDSLIYLHPFHFLTFVEQQKCIYIIQTVLFWQINSIELSLNNMKYDNCRVTVFDLWSNSISNGRPQKHHLFLLCCKHLTMINDGRWTTKWVLFTMFICQFIHKKEAHSIAFCRVLCYISIGGKCE